MDVLHHLPINSLHHCIMIDMGQNILLQSFAGDQPGNTYYMSTLTLLLFGVTDNLRLDGTDHMEAHLWHEKDGKRGMNNTISCSFKYYKEKYFLNQKNYGSLTVVSNNYSSQNKNKAVMRFHTWLVESGVFLEV